MNIVVLLLALLACYAAELDVRGINFEYLWTVFTSYIGERDKMTATIHNQIYRIIPA